MTKESGQYVVLVGNPLDGTSVYGPFNDANDAGDWAGDEMRNETWWTVSVLAPTNYEGDA